MHPAPPKDPLFRPSPFSDNVKRVRISHDFSLPPLPGGSPFPCSLHIPGFKRRPPLSNNPPPLIKRRRSTGFAVQSPESPLLPQSDLFSSGLQKVSRGRSAIITWPCGNPVASVVRNLSTHHLVRRCANFSRVLVERFSSMQGPSLLRKALSFFLMASYSFHPLNLYLVTLLLPNQTLGGTCPSPSKNWPFLPFPPEVSFVASSFSGGYLAIISFCVRLYQGEDEGLLLPPFFSFFPRTDLRPWVFQIPTL